MSYYIIILVLGDFSSTPNVHPLLNQQLKKKRGGSNTTNQAPQYAIRTRFTPMLCMPFNSMKIEIIFGETEKKCTNFQKEVSIYVTVADS